MTTTLVAGIAVAVSLAALWVLIQVLRERRYERLKQQHPAVYDKLISALRQGSYFRDDDPEAAARALLGRAVEIVKKGRGFEVELKGGEWHWEKRTQGYTDGGSHDYTAGQPFQVKVSDGDPLSIKLNEVDKRV